VKTKLLMIAVSCGLASLAFAATPDDGSVLPFPPTPMKDNVAKPLHFTSNATFDIGTDLDSPVLLDDFDQAPFPFNGKIGATEIRYLKK
jgi:hypothetical protein